MYKRQNYPYTVSFFYVTMGLFFTCLLGRENRDIAYSLSLPVAKRDIVTARISFAALIELISLALTAAAVLIVPYHANAAGMDPNLALIGWGFITYGVFNLVFFMMYYGNVNRVGVSFAAVSYTHLDVYKRQVIIMPSYAGVTSRCASWRSSSAWLPCSVLAMCEV